MKTFLFYFRSSIISVGFLLLMADIPGELLHRQFGALKYSIDVLIFLHFFILLIVLLYDRTLIRLLLKIWPLFALSFLALPMAFNLNPINGEHLADLVIPLKWYFLWIYSVVLGFSAFFIRSSLFLRLTLLLFFLMVLIDAGIGFREYRSGEFFFTGSNSDETALGVRESKLKLIEGVPRIKGLDRDVFSFSNLMGTAFILSLGMMRFCRSWILKLICFFLLFPLGGMLLFSGGRSALFGIALGFIPFIASLISVKLMRQNASILCLFFIGVLGLVTMLGIGQLTIFIGKNLMPEQRLADPENAFERDELWKSIKETLSNSPQILIVGAPVAALFSDGDFPPRFEYTDNQLLWFLYHSGIIGLCFLFYFFGFIVETGKNELVANWSFVLFLFFLAFVCGESIARDALFFNGGLFLFILSGYLIASFHSVIGFKTKLDLKSKRIFAH